jgi:hypothetical protein
MSVVSGAALKMNICDHVHRVNVRIIDDIFPVSL